MRRPLGVVEHLLHGHAQVVRAGELGAHGRVGVAAEAGEVAAADLQPQRVPRLERVGHVPQVDGQLRRLAGGQEPRLLERVAEAGAQDAVRHDRAVAARLHVHELAREVRVGGAARDPEVDRDVARDGQRLQQARRGVDEHVVALLHLRLVAHAAGAGDGREGAPADRGHGVLGVVAVAVGDTGRGGRLGRERAIAEARVRVAAAVQVPGRGLAGRRPRVRLAPGVLVAHQEPARAGPRHQGRVLALQPVAEPLQEDVADGGDAAERAPAELAVARAREVVAHVGVVVPRPRDEAVRLADARVGVALERQVQVEVALQELVVPARDVHHRGRDLVRAGGHVEPLPVVVVGVVVDELMPVGEDVALAQDGRLAQRQRAQEGGAVGGALRHLPAQGALPLGVDAEARHRGRGPPLRVAEVEAQFERPAAVDPAVVEVGGGQVGHHRLEVGRRGGGRLQRGHAHVGGAVDAHLAVAPGLDRRPLDRVVAVVALVAVERHHALRLEAAAAVLHHHRVAVFGGDDGVDHLAAHVLRDRLVVGDAVDEHGVALAVVGPVDVGGEAHAVAHRGHHVAFDQHLGRAHACVPPSMTSWTPVTNEASSEAR